MKLLTREVLAVLPPLGAQREKPEPIAYAKFFTPDGSWTWFATEGSPEGDDFLMFGYVIGIVPEWGYFALSEIESMLLEELKCMSVPLLDRAAIEKLFGVRRRRAIQLMSTFGGGYLIGKTFLIDRLQLIANLEIISRGEEFLFEHRRKERLAADLDRSRKELAGRRVVIPTASEAHERWVKDLPVGIHLKAGELRIEFHGTEDLLRHLFELSQAILNDYKKFTDICESGMSEV
jgi:hypothetical protein